MAARRRAGTAPRQVGALEAAALLRDKSAVLLEAWGLRVLADPRVPTADHLTKPALLDHFPALVERVAQALERASRELERPSIIGNSVGRSEASHAHASERFAEGFALPEALRELTHLRMAILDLLDTEGLTMDSMTAHLIHAGVDEMMTTASVEIARLDRVALDEHAQIAKEARARAEEAARTKDAFLTTLSHELRTPLNAVLGWARILRAKAEDPADRERAMDAIDRNALALARLVDDMLDVSTIVAGKIRLVLEPLDLATTVEAALETLRPIADAKRTVVHVSSVASIFVLGDRDRLVQMFWNLLTNALKFSQPGGRIDVRLDTDGDVARVAITDFGDGIPPSFLPKIFERFQQPVESVGRTRGGVGLGLAIVRDLVELHGGSVEAHSEGKGAGSTFTVTLPLRQAENPAEGRD